MRFGQDYGGTKFNEGFQRDMATKGSGRTRFRDCLVLAWRRPATRPRSASPLQTRLPTLPAQAALLERLALSAAPMRSRVLPERGQQLHADVDA